MLCGWDPLTYAGAAGADRIFADLVLQRANTLRVEELARFAEAVGQHAAAALGRMFSG